MGAVVLEQTSDAILTLTNQALTRLLNLTLIATSLAAVGLLSFATLLSVRLRRLRNAAEAAVSPEGRIEARIPETRSRDELGDLSRSFSTLLERLRQFTQYLQTLAGKLSHELRTPLAVVRTSLDNLDSETLEPAAQTYADRAREGSERLASILQAMSAATRVEQAIHNAEAQALDLGELLQATVSAYRDVYAERRLELDIPAGPLHFVGVPDLLVQMLDKLVDNAVDFSADGGRIDIRLEAQRDGYELSVCNEGPPLPEQMRSQLFDSMVSVREEKGETPHLGLGLTIVRLIAEFHRGTISADNLPDGSGVVFRVRLPVRSR